MPAKFVFLVCLISIGFANSSAQNTCQELLTEAFKDGPPAPGKFVVQCSDDGNYESLQCHGSTGACWCVDVVSGEEVEGSRAGPEDSAPQCSVTACQKEVAEASKDGPPLPGKMVVTCADNGLYEIVQCHGSTGECWCVDVETGEEVEDTRTGRGKGPPQCSLTACQKELAKAIRDGPPPPGQMVVQCTDEGNYESMQCHGSTGECWCVNIVNGDELQGTRKGPTEDSPDCEMAESLPSDNNAVESCSDNEELVKCGSTLCEISCELPAVCTSQCEGKACHCKQGFFRHSDGTCVEASKCELTQECHQKVLKLFSEGPPPGGTFVPVCGPDGLFHPWQCHGDPGECWCVDRATGEEINGTRKGESEGLLECSDMTDCQRDLSQATQEDSPILGQFVVQCTDDGYYEPLQCHGSTGECWCVDVISGEEVQGSRAGPLDTSPDCSITGSSDDKSSVESSRQKDSSTEDNCKTAIDSHPDYCKSLLETSKPKVFCVLEGFTKTCAKTCCRVKLNRI